MPIIWTNDGLIYLCINVSLSLNKLSNTDGDLSFS